VSERERLSPREVAALVDVGVGGGFRFRSPAEVVEAAERFVADHPPLLDGYLHPSLVTLLNGRFKGGKSTWVWCLVAALLRGDESFCGRRMPGRPVGVVYLTEEPDIALLDKVRGLGPGVRILNRSGLPRPRPEWGVTIAEAIAEAVAKGCELLVLDTFAEWAMVADENAAPEVQRAVDVLRQATDAGLAVLVLHHFRKGWKAVLDDGEAGRGSTALLGAANVVIDLAPVKDGDRRDRQLLAIGHLPVPDALIVRRTGTGYTVVSTGEREEARQEAAHERVLEALPSGPPGMDVKGLAAALGVARDRAQRLVKAAYEGCDEVERVGDQTTHAYRYWRVPVVTR
jgi:hypothetical protein